MRVSIFAAITILACIAAPLSRAAERLDLSAKIDPHAKLLIENKLAVGFVVGVYKQGQAQILAYGEKTRGSGVAPDGDTVYEIGSVSKVFTGVLLADMVERGMVRLDDPAQKYLPDDVKLPVVNNEPITLEQLSTQRSGLPRLPENMQPADLENPYADYTPEQMLSFLRAVKLERAPGKYEYSNLGVGLLGYLLARRATMNYELLLTTRITGPLNMPNTGITLSPRLSDQMATPYDASLKETKRWDIPTLAGAGAIRSTVVDMVRFIRANLNDDPSQPLAAALKLAQKKRHDIDGGLAIGLGWHIAKDQVTRWHNGCTGGYSSWLSIVPGADVGVVVLSNSANSDEITSLGERVTRIAFGNDVEPPQQKKTVAVDPAVLAKYVGAYAIVPEFVLTVTLEDGQLMVQATGQGKAPVFASAPNKFFYKIVDAQLTFVPGDDGKFNKLILHQNGLNQEARRTDANPPAQPEAINVDPAVLKTYVGKYAITPQFVMTVTLKDGQLSVQATGQGKLPMFASAPDKFFLKAVDAQITFVADDKGKIKKLILHQNGLNQDALRKN